MSDRHRLRPGDALLIGDELRLTWRPSMRLATAAELHVSDSTTLATGTYAVPPDGRRLIQLRDDLSVDAVPCDDCRDLKIRVRESRRYAVTRESAVD